MSTKTGRPTRRAPMPWKSAAVRGPVPFDALRNRAQSIYVKKVVPPP